MCPQGFFHRQQFLVRCFQFLQVLLQDFFRMFSGGNIDSNANNIGFSINARFHRSELIGSFAPVPIA